MEMRQPGAIMAADGGIVICDQNNNKIRFFEVQGVQAVGEGKTIVKPADADMPAGIALGSDGSYFFTDLGGQQIKRYHKSSGVTAVAGHKTSQEQAAVEDRGVMASFKAPYGTWPQTFNETNESFGPLNTEPQHWAPNTLPNLVHTRLQ